MVSYYHQVYSLTALRELVFPLTLPWCRTTTKSSHSLSHCLLSHSHSHGVVLPPSLPTHCSERTCAPTHTPMVSYYHQVFSHTHSHTVFSLTHTSMVSYYHQVITLTALRELVLPLTLPWCRTTTKSSHTHTNPCAPTHSHLPCPHTLCSPHFISPPSRYKCITNASQMHHQPSPTLSHPSCLHHIIITSSPHSRYKCITNASPMHHQPSPTLSHPSCLHHIIITSSPLPITYHHQSLPLTPHNTPNPSISLPTLPIVS